jgi:hypothetical protein
MGAALTTVQNKVKDLEARLLVVETATKALEGGT